VLGHARLDRNDLRRPLPNYLHTPTRKVAERAISFEHAVALGQQTKPKNVREMTRIGFVTAMLKTVVLFDCCGVCQVKRMSGRN
jgi:hypothetical protein